jgi:cell division protein FtsB
MKKIILMFIIFLFLYLFVNQIFILHKQSNIKEGMELIWKNSGNIKSLKENVNKMKNQMKIINDNSVSNIQRVKNNTDTIDKKNQEKENNVRKQTNKFDNISA